VKTIIVYIKPFNTLSLLSLVSYECCVVGVGCVSTMRLLY